MPDDGLEKQVYILENLGCAHCASKMEAKIKELPGVKYATITYATKQLRLAAEDPQQLLPKIQKICTSIESEVKVVPRGGKLPGSFQTKTYLLENLGCAHCASKMEEQIGKLEGVTDATITFATKQLRVTAKIRIAILPRFVKSALQSNRKYRFLRKILPQKVRILCRWKPSVLLPENLFPKNGEI